MQRDAWAMCVLADAENTLVGGLVLLPASQYFFSIRFGWRPLHFMQYFAGGTLCEEGPKVASLARPGEHTPPSGKLPEP